MEDKNLEWVKEVNKILLKSNKKTAQKDEQINCSLTKLKKSLFLMTIFPNKQKQILLITSNTDLRMFSQPNLLKEWTRIKIFSKRLWMTISLRRL